MRKILIFLILGLILLNSYFVNAGAGTYCTKLGYEWKVITRSSGGQYGICKFLDGSECGDWAFYKGECGQKWSYCKQNGYDLITKRGNEDPFTPGAYSVCINKTTGEEVGAIFNLLGMTVPSGVPAYVPVAPNCAKIEAKVLRIMDEDYELEILKSENCSDKEYFFKTVEKGERYIVIKISSENVTGIKEGSLISAYVKEIGDGERVKPYLSDIQILKENFFKRIINWFISLLGK